MDKMEVKLRFGRPTFNLRICWLRLRPAPGILHFMANTEETKFIQLLLARLERVSVDSYWAHRASGIRGALLKTSEALEQGTLPGRGSINELISSALKILTEAAREKH